MFKCHKAVLVFLVFALVYSARAVPQNILLLIADDYGVDSSSLYNTHASASLPPTPNMEALAQTGVLFRNAYANPVCSPTRACLITGRHGFRTGIGDVVMGMGSAALTSTEFTLPEAFAANAGLGYQLAQFGKWHLNSSASSPNNIGGWPHFAGSLIGALANYTNWTKTVNGMSSTSTNYATTDLVNDAVAWIQAHGANPWFAWVAFNAPHTPLHKPPNSLCPHYTTLSGTQSHINANPRLYFEAMVEAMDTEIGRLLAAVNRTNTHIIFLGDNGTMNNQLQPPFPAGHGKDTLYEGGIHVPLIVAGPSVVQPGRSSDVLVHAVDLFATILELAGISSANTVPTNVTIDSRSFLPVLLNQSDTRSCVYSEMFSATISTDGGRALRDDRYKLICFRDGHDEFYDLQMDPTELTNLLTVQLTLEQQQHRDRLLFWLAGYSAASGPRIASQTWSGGQFSTCVPEITGATYTLWRCEDFSSAFWAPVSNAQVTSTNSIVTLTDLSPPPLHAFYSVVQTTP